MKNISRIKGYILELENRVSNLRVELKESMNKTTKDTLNGGIHFIQANINTLNWVLEDDIKGKN